MITTLAAIMLALVAAAMLLGLARALRRADDRIGTILAEELDQRPGDDDQFHTWPAVRTHEGVALNRVGVSAMAGQASPGSATCFGHTNDHGLVTITYLLPRKEACPAATAREASRTPPKEA